MTTADAAKAFDHLCKTFETLHVALSQGADLDINEAADYTKTVNDGKVTRTPTGGITYTIKLTPLTPTQETDPEALHFKAIVPYCPTCKSKDISDILYITVPATWNNRSQQWEPKIPKIAPITCPKCGPITAKWQILDKDD